MNVTSIRRTATTLGAVLMAALLTPCFADRADDGRRIDLSGRWSFALDKKDRGVEEHWYDSLFKAQLMLPGTLDAAGVGDENRLLPKLEKPQVLHLTRKYSYVGPAWYVRDLDIPAALAGKELTLTLERVLWTSEVWIDGKPIGKGNSLVSPHRYTLPALKQGSHRIAIRIDNRKQFDISYNDMAHAYTNETQVMWNGILGEVSLTPKERVSIRNVSVYPDIQKKGVRVVVEVSNGDAASVKGALTLTADLKGRALKPVVEKVVVTGKESRIERFYPLGNDMALWDEHTPNLYSLRASLKCGSTTSAGSATFGMRQLSNEGGLLRVNGTRVFLRGTLECSIFPLSGTPPTSKEGWQKVFGTAKSYGLNHLRFHSWCPPKAAFDVADEMGVYLQIELPLWSLVVGKDSATTRFIRDEAVRISKEYGNHPSFCLWSMGNELEGDASVLTSLVGMLKGLDGRHLYTSTTFSFQKGLGTKPLPADDYFVTQWTDNGWIRGQGIFNSEPPAFDKDYSKSLKDIGVPVISHEIGQYSVYPNIREIEKYKGTLIPLNLMAVKEDLVRRGMVDRADDYLYSTGKLAKILYKEEIERALKTPGFSGFQLLDLHDFPGQGTALVGLLDAFWESKGVVEPDEFRSFCGPVVPLASFPKAVYLSSESFTASLGISNFSGKSIDGGRLAWTLTDALGGIVAKGSLSPQAIQLGYTPSLGMVEVPLGRIGQAQKLQLTLQLEGTNHHNSWSIWVYPANLKVNAGDVVVATELSAATKALAEGRKVLFCPAPGSVKGIEGKFVPVFWSPVHFPKQAGSMGVLCNPSDRALAHFPTDKFTDWQWWDINKRSTPVVLDSISAVRPLVSVIDNFVTNRRLATVFETRCGKGTLIFCSVDLTSDMEKRPVARQLLYSLLSYMNSADFNPSFTIDDRELSSLILTKP